jgi:hypothetical protein
MMIYKRFGRKRSWPNRSTSLAYDWRKWGKTRKLARISYALTETRIERCTTLSYRHSRMQQPGLLLCFEMYRHSHQPEPLDLFNDITQICKHICSILLYLLFQISTLQIRTPLHRTAFTSHDYRTWECLRKHLCCIFIGLLNATVLVCCT